LGKELLRLGLLQLVEDPYPVVNVSEEGLRCLKERQRVQLTRASVRATSKRRTKREKFSEKYDESLFEDLRQVRNRLARHMSVPAYVIFGDATLVEMAGRRPLSIEALADIGGVGAKKLAQFGAEFVNAIRSYLGEDPLENDSVIPLQPSAEPATAALVVRAPKKPKVSSDSISDSAQLTLEAFTGGLSLEEIAQQRQLSLNTIQEHLCECLVKGALKDISRLVEIGRQERISVALYTLGHARIKPVKEQLGEEVSYTEIQLVRALLRGQGKLVDSVAEEHLQKQLAQGS
jgi:ATP-dependent DNA helicase RecQ